MENINSIILNQNAFNTTFVKGNVVSIDLSNIPWKDNSMANAFRVCSKLTGVSNVNNNVENMYNTFYSCSSLVNAPVIPNSVVNMYQTFSNCRNLVNAPVIPNSVTNMVSTFERCLTLVNAPDIPNSVIYIDESFRDCYNLVNAPRTLGNTKSFYYTFNRCYNLVNAPVIPNSAISIHCTFQDCRNLVNAPDLSNCSNLIDMTRSFSSCYKLKGDILIKSENVHFCLSCVDDYYQTSLTKNVYIPFTYNNDKDELLECWYYNDYNSDEKIKIYSPINSLDYGQYSYYDNNMNIFHEVLKIRDGYTTVWLSDTGRTYQCYRDEINDITIHHNAGEYTRTYNSFTNAGYSPINRVNGVCLFDINSL
jgi:hypothetical protein